MATISLTWKDLNIGEDGFNIYRSESPMDVNNMPSPIATVSENVGSYDDGGVVPETIYYYRIGVMRNGEELISEEQRVTSFRVHGPDTILSSSEGVAYYGEFDSSNFIDGDSLASYFSFTQGNSVNSDSSWLKFEMNGEFFFTPKKHFRTHVSWNGINSVDLVYGDRSIEINGLEYTVRLLKGATNDPASVPLGVSSGHPEFEQSEFNLFFGLIDGSYTDYEIGTGFQTITKETYASDSSRCISRARESFDHGNTPRKSDANSGYVWRPVLILK